MLDQIGGFESIRSAVIDDCALARRVKLQGSKIWLGLTHSVKSVRTYQHLREIWDMVARTAFAQLHYSVGLLILCTLVMLLVYQVPVVMVASSNILIRYLAVGFVSDHVPNLRADTPILSSIMGVGARSAFDCRDFSRHDLDVRNPLLAGRTHPLERQGLSVSSCYGRLF